MGETISPTRAQVLVLVVPTDVVDILVRRISRQSKPPRRNYMEDYLVHESHEVLIVDKEEPTTYKATIASSDTVNWL